MTDIVSQKALGHLGAISALIREQSNIINEQLAEIKRLRNEIQRITGKSIADEPTLDERVLLGITLALDLPLNKKINPTELLPMIQNLTAARMLRQPNFGPKSLKSLEKWLNYHGTSLADRQIEGKAE